MLRKGCCHGRWGQPKCLQTKCTDQTSMPLLPRTLHATLTLLSRYLCVHLALGSPHSHATTLAGPRDPLIPGISLRLPSWLGAVQPFLQLLKGVYGRGFALALGQLNVVPLQVAGVDLPYALHAAGLHSLWHHGLDSIEQGCSLGHSPPITWQQSSGPGSCGGTSSSADCACSLPDCS